MTSDQELPAVLGGFDLADQSRFAAGVPYELFARLRREAPVLFHPGGRTADGDGFWVLTRHADIVAAAASEDFSAQGGGDRVGGGSHLEDLPMGVHAGVLFAMMDNPRHELIRRLLRPAVTGEVAQGLAEPMRGIAAELLGATLDRGGRADFMKDLSELYALRAIALLLGAPRADWDRLTDWGRVNLGFVNRRTGTVDAGSTEVFHAMSAYFTELLDRKRQEPAEDLASVLARGAIAQEHGEPPLTTRERDANAVLLLITGFEQPRNTIASGVLALAQHPEQWQALRKDRSLLPQAVEEILRWAPPTPTTGAPPPVTSNSTAGSSGPGTRSPSGGRPPTGTRRSSTTPRRSTSAGPAIPTCPSERAPTSAWASRWPAWRSGSSWRPCWTGWRKSGSPGRSCTPPTTSTP